MNSKTYSWKRLILSLYLFIVIFQPQILPISTIYVVGFFTFVYLVIDNRGKINLSIPIVSGMAAIYKAFVALAIYTLFVSLINALLGGITAFENTLRCINQLVVLTGIEFICICFFIKKCGKYCFKWKDIVWMISVAGIVQGLCSISAYISPDIRSFFLRYNGEVFRNVYVLERRGYGFSNILLDTYGYGMGLIAGIVLLSKDIKLSHKLLCIALCLFSIFFNARTGVVVFGIAVAIYLFQTNSIPKFLIKSGFAVLLLILLWNYALPMFIDFLISSNSISLKWVGTGLEDILAVLTSNSSLNDTDALSSFSHFPNNFLIMIFGSGHNVYGISQIIGFHSDVGFINYLWEFGILGTLIMAIALTRMYLYSFKYAKGSDKFIVLFLTVSYVVVLFKGILIGYNPGVVVNYLICFAMVFFSSKNSYTE